MRKYVVTNNWGLGWLAVQFLANASIPRSLFILITKFNLSRPVINMSASIPSLGSRLRRKKQLRPQQLSQSMLQARIRVLELAIGRLDGRKPERRDKHLAEIAQLNIQLGRMEEKEVQLSLDQLTMCV